MNWECTPLLTISQRLPILVSRHRCWWVSCVPQSYTGDDARLNFTHYLYMPLANSGESYHRRVSEAKLQRACGQDDELRTGLGAAYMRDCFRAQTFDSDYVDEWHLPNATQPRRSCLRRTFPPSCNAVPRACFWCTWMTRGLCVQTQTSGEVP